MKKISLFAVLALALAVIPAHATLELISQAIGYLFVPPASVLPGKLTSNSYVFLFQEKQNYTLAAPLNVDITVPNTYTESSELTPGQIPAGTVVNSYFLHANPSSGNIQFDAEALGFSADEVIVAAIVTPANLAASAPVVGHPGTTYNSASKQTGLHLAPQGKDSIEISSDLSTLTFTEELKSTTVTEIRLITELHTSAGQSQKKTGAL